MDFIDVLKKRRSVRKFQNKDISLEVIYEMIDLANSSPSAGNLQARSVMIIKDKQTKDELKKVTRGFSKFDAEIPVIIVVLAKLKESEERFSERGRSLYAIQDATIFASYLQLIAASKGLSTRWVGSFDENEIKKVLSLPDDLRPIAMIPIGYAAEEPIEKEKKSLKEIIYKEV